MKKTAITYCIIFIFLAPFAAQAKNTNNVMSAVQENMQRMEHYKAKYNLQEKAEKGGEHVPDTTLPNSVVHPNTSLQDKAKLINLLNRITLNEDEKKELITLIRNK